MAWASISSARRAAAVSVEKYGLPVPAAKIDHAPQLEVAQRPPSYVGLADRSDLDGAHDAHDETVVFEGVLQREGVLHGGDHADVVGRRAVHAPRGRRDAAEDVAAAHDDGHLDADLASPLDVRRYLLRAGGVDGLCPSPASA